NSVSVIDLNSKRVTEVLITSLFPDAPVGSTPNSVAISENGKTLYIANADNNCISVFDISDTRKSTSKGFIPVGWYPTCVRVSGNTMYVTNGKG
ncbi:beta-propeller fold lactonase family protein, partial [Klebsiella pneumoniae]